MNKIIIDRKSKEIIKIRENILLVFLYNTIIGRCILKIVIRSNNSRFLGKYFDSKLSRHMIKRFILKNKINMKDYYKSNYQSFNEFFTRKIKKSSRKISNDSKVFISPCDAKLSVYKVDDDLTFRIKRSSYSLNDLLGCDFDKIGSYSYALVFRLCVDDYHRYIFVDDGTIDNYHKIDGLLHAVRPIAQNRYPVFFQNQREWTLLHTKNFGDIVQIEVGALMVGKIINHMGIKRFHRGNEKGYFKFGGSTIVLLVNDVEIDRDILENSENNLETVVKMGEKIGRKKSH